MSQNPQSAPASEAEARDVAEAAREQSWEKPSFVRQMFLGRLQMELIDPYPEQDPVDAKACDELLAKVRKVLVEKIDADEVDRTGDLPDDAIAELWRIGAMSIKIPREYGGQGLSQASYNRIIEVVAAHCGSTAIFMSAHQSIGVPQPLKLFGTEEQKRKWLPRLATKDLSAFALTEPQAGSDPANMTTTARLEGDEWVLDGVKLWCTNGPIADVAIVMAQTPPKMVNGREKRQISAFIVEMNKPGIEVVHRCEFMGVRAINNGVLKFTDVRLPKDSLLGQEGGGLKLALITLNTGRLTLPSCCAASAKACLGITRRWAAERVQWGVNIGKHDEIAGMVGEMAADVFAMQAVADLGCRLVDQAGTDIRLEAALAKLYNSERGWKLVNDCYQIRGGRGYETAKSLVERGDTPEPVERILRDFRINTVVEGSTQIMHLFIAREALDAHMTVAGALLDPRSSFGAKFKAFLRSAAHYAVWYPKQWVGWGWAPRFSQYGPLATHVRFLDRHTRKLSRATFHCMMRYQQGLERRGRILARIVDASAEMYAMAATISRARAMAKTEVGSDKAMETADQFCRGARVRITELLRTLHGSGNDRRSYRFAQQVLAGQHRWLEDGILQPEDFPSHEAASAAAGSPPEVAEATEATIEG